MPDLANRSDHEAALAAAIRPVFLSIAAQGASPKWDEAGDELARALLSPLANIYGAGWRGFATSITDYEMNMAATRQKFVSQIDNADAQAKQLARSLIYAREDAWIAARRTARDIEPPAGESDISDELLTLYLLYGLPGKRPFGVGVRDQLAIPAGIPSLMSPMLRTDLQVLDRSTLPPAWEAHLADYVPGAGRGLVAITLGPEAASDIAVTETTRANSRAERAAAEDFERATGVRVVAYWQAENDSRTCPICNGLDGKPEAVWLREFPDGPPGHPNCRCWLTWKPEQ